MYFGSAPFRYGFVFIFWVVPAALLFADSRNILTEETTDLQSVITQVDSLIKRHLVDAQQANDFILKWKERLTVLASRNQLLDQKASSSHFTIYASTKESAEKYLQIAEETLDVYESCFTTLIFSPSTPAQILLYPSRAEYLKYDGISSMVLGHALSNRQKSWTIIKRSDGYHIEQTISSSKKYHRLATSEEKSPFVFIHEVCHIFTYEIVNPRQLDLAELRPSVFLNEGISEFFAAKRNPDVFKSRALGLLGGKRTDGTTVPPAPPPNLATMFKSGVNLNDANKAQNFYSEATLTIRWLLEMPEGPQLVRNLLVADPDQMEGILRNYQRNCGMPADGFAAYAAYRQKILDELKLAVAKTPPETAQTSTSSEQQTTSKRERKQRKNEE